MHETEKMRDRKVIGARNDPHDRKCACTKPCFCTFFIPVQMVHFSNKTKNALTSSMSQVAVKASCTCTCLALMRFQL
jgi:hypothetical protein